MYPLDTVIQVRMPLSLSDVSLSLSEFGEGNMNRRFQRSTREQTEWRRRVDVPVAWPGDGPECGCVRERWPKTEQCISKRS